MTALGFRAPLFPDQTVASFISALAAQNGAEYLYTFCGHMGLLNTAVSYSSRSVQTCDTLNIERIADLSCLSARQLMDSAIHRIDKHWVSIREQKIWQKDVAYDGFRHCPECMEEDMDNGKGPSELRTYARTWWLVKTVESCPKHRVRLVTSSCEVEWPRGGDFANYIRNNQAELSRLHRDRQSVAYSPVDQYQVRRLRGEHTVPLLDALPFFGAIELCEVVGGMNKLADPFFRRDLCPSEELRTCRDHGFELLSRDGAPLYDFLQKLFEERWTSRTSCSHKVYGGFYTWLTRKIDDPDFEPVISTLKSHAMDNLPLGPEDTFFFEIAERRKHSFHSLARKLGTHHTRVEKLLLLAGFTSADEIARSKVRLLFDSQPVEQFFQTLRDTMQKFAAANFLQISHIGFDWLLEAGYVTLRPLMCDDGSIRPACRRDELLDLQTRATRRATEVEKRPKETFSIGDTAIKLGCSWIDVFRLLARGVLKECVYVDDRTIGALRLNLEEVRKKLPKRTSKSANFSKRLIADRLPEERRG